MLAIGQKPRIAMRNLGLRRVECRQRRRLPSGGRDTEEATSYVWRKYNDIVRVPGAAEAERGVTQRQGGTTAHVDLLQFAARKKRDDAAVRLPERKSGLVGASKWTRGQRIEVAQPQLVLAVQGGHEGEMTPVGGHGWKGACERRFLRRQDGHLQRARLVSRTGEVRRRQHQRRDGGDRRHHPRKG